MTAGTAEERLEPLSEGGGDLSRGGCPGEGAAQTWAADIGWTACGRDMPGFQVRTSAHGEEGGWEG